GSGTVNLTRINRFSSCCSQAKMSPGLTPGTTTRRLASAVTVIVGLSHKPGVLSIHFEKCWQKMAHAGWNNHLDGMSVKHWKIPFISGGIGRNTAVSTNLQVALRPPPTLI